MAVDLEEVTIACPKFFAATSRSIQKLNPVYTRLVIELETRSSVSSLLSIHEGIQLSFL